MTSRWVGVWGAIAICLVASVAHAAQATTPVLASANTRQVADGDIVYTVTRGPGKITFRAEGRGARLEKVANQDRIEVVMTAGDDSLRVAITDGAVIQVQRGQSGSVVRFEHPLTDRSSELQDILRSSEALKGLDRLASAADASSRPEASSVLATFALMRALQGDPAGNHLLSRKLRRARPQPVLQKAAQRTREDPYYGVVDTCWEEYQRTLDRNYARYDACLREYWWLQPMQYACGLEFAMVAELAMFRLISCVGGMPVG